MPSKGRIACRRHVPGNAFLLLLLAMTMVSMALAMSEIRHGLVDLRQFLCRSRKPNRLALCRPTVLLLPSTTLCFSFSNHFYGDFSNRTKDSNSTSSHLVVPARDTLDLPFRKFGYRSLPFTWKELKQIVVEESDLSRLSRSVETERRYKADRERLLKEYESLYDHILYTKFNFPRRLDESTGKWKVDTPTDLQEKSAPPHRISIFSLVKNDYPYHLEAGIEHWVLWKLHSNVTKEDVVQAIEKLNVHYGDREAIDSIWWENPPSLKSLPDISHVHILLRRKSKLWNDNCPSEKKQNGSFVNQHIF
jgi:hypothetical protein